MGETARLCRQTLWGPSEVGQFRASEPTVIGIDPPLKKQDGGKGGGNAWEGLKTWTAEVEM